jgi:hypothetical protein
LFCKRKGKWTEIPYMQLFFFLKEHPQWVKQCKEGAQTLTTVYKNLPKEGDTSKTPLVALKKATSSSLLVPGGRGSHTERIHVPFRSSNLKEIKWDLGSFSDDPDWYIQACITVIQTFELAWKDVMLLQIKPSLPWSGKESLIKPLRLAMVITYKSPLLRLHPRSGSRGPWSPHWDPSGSQDGSTVPRGPSPWGR